ncbi:SEL1-like repeat protein [Klebsiella huaxiensis]|uniref:Secretory immunoglobulin A-binding protein EsiB n=1 Tax=Klebsiella huaxiensis TaxID=2153354 RepID=A0A564MBH4_9ENTR|nr:SEL1-like repeat protein [Klebsiella huaxiensis]VUS91107.1 Secretory immunoglobulin A-binding protein EsiB [Klebsiella huaxiensis]
MSCWEILGLTPGAGAREIKRCFAQRVKINRPEEDPQAYQRLRDAYEQALAFTDDHSSQPNVEPGATAGVRPVVLPRVTPVSPPPPVIRENGWAEVLESLFVENKRLPEAADLQLERALVDLVAFDLQSRLQFETTLMAKLARDHRPLLMLAAAEKFKWHLVTDKTETRAQNTINDHCLIYRRIAQNIAPLFFNGMSCIEEVECGEKLYDIFAALEHDAQSLQWFDIAVLLKIAGLALSADYLGMISEKIRWTTQTEKIQRAQSLDEEKSVLVWNLNERFCALASIHQSAYQKVVCALQLESDGYHVSKVLSARLKAAEQGDIEACFSIGKMYYGGFGVLQDESQAMHWYLRAAEQGLVPAQYHLAQLYERKRNNNAAFQWYSRAAEQGHASAQYALGRLYTGGFGVTQNRQQGILWFSRAAEQNDDYAQYALGVICLGGDGIDTDCLRAFGLFRQAALQGNAAAQLELAHLYYNGQAVERDVQQALVWYTKAAEQNNGDAQYWLGKIYSEGELAPPDRQKALTWYSKAAEQGSGEAMFELGCLYYRSEHIAADIEQAVHWLSEAAQRGVAQAAFMLAEIYAAGKDGVKKDPNNAFYWYEKAARLGSVQAQGKFAAMYALGMGKEQSYLEAWAWVIIAGGDNPYIDKETVRQKLSAEEMTEAQAMAARYRRIFRLK